MTQRPDEQRPAKGSREERALQQVTAFYAARKPRFEALALLVTQRILNQWGGRYVAGWVTPPSADGGADFVGRLDIGSDFSSTKLVVLGQAKCEKPQAPTNGRDIARTVARLRRGWVGVYVTTSYFSEATQREVIEDGYPIVLVHGLRVSHEVLALAHEQGYSSVTRFLEGVDPQYDAMVHARRPEEVLQHQESDWG